MDEPALGALLPVWSALPFVGILLSIALLPLAAPRFWHAHHAKVAVGWALVFGLPFLAVYRSAAAHQIAEIYLAHYVPFMVLLGGLFTVAGGVVVRGAPAGTPLVNTAFLAIGTALASWIGTTGAAMLLIRPLLRANAGRRHQTHLVTFFIFLVANVGGCLTPLGDPPLFLGFLEGVPFFWTMRLAAPLGVSAAVLLATFFAIDRWLWRRDLRSGWRPAPAEGRLRIEGLVNFALLGGIIGAVLLSGIWKAGSVRIAGVDLQIQNLTRDAIIVLLATVSLTLTSAEVRRANEFSWGPIREVAWLFAGIFMTILPTLLMLGTGPLGQLGFLMRPIERPWQFFWATGGLSAFLDNAPTYLAFLRTLAGRFHPGLPEAEAVRQIVTGEGLHLEAIAAGAVFMGAMTYIGNAPNFMIKAIAEEAGVAMPSFFGYLFRWSIPVLIPLFLLLTWLFYRG